MIIQNAIRHINKAQATASFGIICQIKAEYKLLLNILYRYTMCRYTEIYKTNQGRRYAPIYEPVRAEVKTRL